MREGRDENLFFFVFEQKKKVEATDRRCAWAGGTTSYYSSFPDLFEIRAGGTTFDPNSEHGFFTDLYS